MEQKVKICCVGFQKTGTTSLKRALERLGYSVGAAHQAVGSKLDEKPTNPDFEVKKIVLEHMEGHDALQDSPCAWMFEELDEAFPNSKFILTYRSVDSWLESYARYFPDNNNSLRQWMYGVPNFSEHQEHYRNLYEKQNQKIRDHFSSRPDDFLELDITRGQGWFELVNFLGPEVLPAFPHAKSRTSKSGAGRRKKRGLTAP